ncbi:MAG: rhomboid family intramembrane serine protease [Planctomycetes bacterium]|nr:rhomboid family intramembrane serine protease [Planctomycetota bacterium]
MSNGLHDDHDDVLEIGSHMLHRERAEFEDGMGFFPPVTIVLCVLCVVAFFAQLAIGALKSEQAILDAGAMSGPLVQAGEVWRMGSAMFLHGSPDHLIGNLIVLYILGMAAEHAYGSTQFLVLYVFAGIVGSAFSMIHGQPSVGASGAVFGIAGGVVAFFVLHHSAFRLRDARVGTVLAIWAVYQIGLGFMNPLVDNMAHLGGFIGGFVIGIVMDRRLQGGTGGDPTRPGQGMALLAAIGVLFYTAINLVPRLMK